MKKGKRSRGKLSIEELVTRYYEDLEKEDPAVTAMFPDHDAKGFEKDKVYRNLNKRTRKLRMIKISLRVAASVALLCSVLYAYQYRSLIAGYAGLTSTTVQTTSYGEIAELTLSDGTRVWLNSGSTITYPDKFNGDSREISLTGEAYLDVAHNPGKPFLIHAGKITVRVLGTRFNISAYEEDQNITVAVVQGKVGVSPNTVSAGDEDRTLYVSPDQQAVYNKESETLLHQEKVKAINTASWKEGKLIYKRTPLPEIIAEVQRKYDVSIYASEQVKDCLISANFDNDSLEKVLTILAELVSGEIINNGTAYFIQGSGCRKE